jgi:imidazolonepropionase-like amidohydrolase
VIWRLRRTAAPPVELDGPVVLRGRLWVGDGVEHDDGRVVVGADGVVAACGPSAQVEVPPDAREVMAGWVGPGIADAHVHLAFGEPSQMLAGGVVAVRDLGAPHRDAIRWRRLPAPRVEIAGPLLTAPGGYPSRSWGSNGFAGFVDEPEQAERFVTALVPNVDVVKLALEPRGGPVPTPEVSAAVVTAAHVAGAKVTAHALTVEMVVRALDAGVDELAHTPVEPLPRGVVTRIAAAGVRVVSTMQTLLRDSGSGGVLVNARAFVEAGVELRYGTDLGNAGTRPGADPGELRLLAETGLGADGALRAATMPIAVGSPAGVVALSTDPRVDPRTWRRPVAVVCATALLTAGT